ncbi:type II secretion system F family protein [Streptomyces sp. NPDC048523]|uniref:type II secretion system F family protein n=1 Tax=Streptomyces sp. NPDC048523 TaxID=3365567 RepID=UPI0037146BCF
MSPSYLSALGMLAGAIVALGLAGFVAALRGWRPAVRGARSGRVRGRLVRAVAELPPAWRDNYRLLLAGAAGAGALMWAVTGWPVHGLLAFAVVAGLPFVLYPGGSGRAEVARLEAIAEWLQQLASVRAGGKPLEATIVELDTVPALLQRPVGALADRLSSGMPARWAYRALADDLASRIGDDICQLFMDHVTSRGPGLARALSAQASLIARQAADLRDIDAERAKARSEARRVSLFAIAVVAVILVNGHYSEPFATPLGQLGLLVLGVLFAACLLWLRTMAQMEEEPRTLLTAEERAKEQEREGEAA